MLEELLKNILGKWLGLLIPSSIALTILVLGYILSTIGFGTVGALFTSIVNFWGEIPLKLLLQLKIL